MTIETSLPIVLVQMAHVEKIAHNETVTPEAQQSTAKLIAAEAVKHDQSSVERAQEGEKAQILLDHDGHGGGKQHTAKRRARAKKHTEEKKDEGASDNTLWQGNILDMKV